MKLATKNLCEIHEWFELCLFFANCNANVNGRLHDKLEPRVGERPKRDLDKEPFEPCFRDCFLSRSIVTGSREAHNLPSFFAKTRPTGALRICTFRATNKFHSNCICHGRIRKRMESLFFLVSCFTQCSIFAFFCEACP